MTAVAVHRPSDASPAVGSVVLALVPALIVAGTSFLVGGFAGRWESFGSVGGYQAVMNLGVLARFFGMFVAVIAVWGVLRSRSAPQWLLGLAIVSGPIAYSVSAFWGAAQFFPIGEAAYYAVNPMAVAAVAGQCAMAGVGEGVWRWRSHRRGNSAPALSWRIAAVVVVGLLVVFVTVLWQGGVPYFYWYQRGYLLLFT